MPNANLVAAQNQLRNLVSIYNRNFDQYQQATYNETQVRVDFVNPFFQLLGWDVLNEAGLPQHLREVTHEATVLVEENGAHRSKKPDYSFKVGTEILFFLETKKPSVNITVDRAPSFQLRRYGWSGNLKVSVLTNFTDLFIYDCTVRPVEGDEIGTALIAHYHYTEYEDKFEEIYSLLSKESVLNGDFQRIFGNVRGAMRREPFDAYFLDQIRGWRNQLGSDVVRNNPNVDAVTLNIFVQRILNRSIFLRICEDKNLENYESLRRITTYQELKDLFAVADQKYDSGLFEMLDEDRLIISDAVIIDIFQSLYYPNNSYEFGVVDPYIIGQIYELFLAETLEIEANGQVVSVKKPEVVDAQGTVNTPKNIDRLNKSSKITNATDLYDVNVGLVSGENAFFVINQEIVDKFHLQESVVPIISRTDQIKGLELTEQDYENLVKAGKKVYFFEPADLPIDELPKSQRKYIQWGEAQEYNKNYKCRIRPRWYHVSYTWRAEAFLVRQANLYPKMVLNNKHALVTDTLHKVRFHEGVDGRTVVGAFLNTYTLALSETLGRSYGGGVLTFEPGEMRKMRIPMIAADKLDLDKMDALQREGKIDDILQYTDEILLHQGLGLTAHEVELLHNIWSKMRDRRLSRKNRKG